MAKKKTAKKVSNATKVKAYAKKLGVRLPHGYETTRRKRK